MSDSHKARWSVSLDTECPTCGHEFDMLCTPDFWEGKSTWQLCEHDTDKTKDVDAHCPVCERNFKVDLEY